MTTDAPVVIIGAGLMGAAAAWSLSCRGVPAVVFEQGEPANASGGSHGSARIVRRAYADPFYVALTGRAFALWDELERTGPPLLRRVGAVDFGPLRDVPGVAAGLAAAGVAHEVLPAHEAEARWPGMRFEGDVLFHPQAGTVDSDAAVRRMLEIAVAGGAQIRTGTRVIALTADGVELDSGVTVAARTVVVAAGGWTQALVGTAVRLPPLRVTRQSVLHLPRVDRQAAPWPSAIHEADRAVYHLAGGRDGGPADDRKIGVHDPGPAAVPGTGDGRLDPAVREHLVEYAARWLPGLIPEPSSETTCLYTATPTEDFLLERVGDVIVCAACSGHGAKFAPLIGELVADLVTGTGTSVPDRFRLAAHDGRVGRASL